MRRKRLRCRGIGVSFLLKSFVFLVILGLIGLTGYAYFGDLAPDQTPVTVPVVLDAGQ